MTDDLSLLRQFEPVTRFTHGEHFFPMDVRAYVTNAALWSQPARAPAVELLQRGAVTLEQLGALPQDDPAAVYFLHFVEPLGPRGQRLVRAEPGRPTFRSRGRLARVGLVPRILDAVFTVTLWMRGTVPGGTALAAEQAYRRIMREDERYVYYGRVVRDGGYVVLHYLFFYCMNDWRSSFFGVNDHEADWEQIFVYLESLDDGVYRPAWVAYASHDDAGDDLRRRWDDPELEKVGTHPVVYVGAGSHASYFSRGEYLITVGLSPFLPAIRFIERLQHFWRVTLGQGEPDAPEVDVADVFRVPFVDYARGDGLSIGPDPAAPLRADWTPMLLDENAGWVTNFRGLWGLFARDPVSGENAPAGPRFNRDGTVRRTWHNPLGWSGAAKVAPPSQSAEVLRARVQLLDEQQVRDALAVQEQHTALTGLYAEYRALADQPHLRRLYQQAWVEVRQAETALLRLRDAIAARGESIRASERELAALEQGDLGPPRVHIERPRLPQHEEDIRQSALAESWAAFSVGLLMIGFVALTVTADSWAIGLGALLAVFALLDSIFRGHFEQLTLRATLGLAIFAALVLIYTFFWQIVLVSVTAVGLLIIVDNVRELRS